MQVIILSQILTLPDTRCTPLDQWNSDKSPPRILSVPKMILGKPHPLRTVAWRRRFLCMSEIGVLVAAFLVQNKTFHVHTHSTFMYQVNFR